MRLEGGELRVGERAGGVARRVALALLPREGDLERVRAEDVRLDELLEARGRRVAARARKGERRKAAELIGRRPPWRRIAGGGAVPDAAAERGDVDLRSVRGIGDDPLAPLEVEAADPRPGLAAVDRAERGLVEAAGVEHVRVARDRR